MLPLHLPLSTNKAIPPLILLRLLLRLLVIGLKRTIRYSFYLHSVACTAELPLKVLYLSRRHLFQFLSHSPLILSSSSINHAPTSPMSLILRQSLAFFSISSSTVNSQSSPGRRAEFSSRPLRRFRSSASNILSPPACANSSFNHVSISCAPTQPFSLKLSNSVVRTMRPSFANFVAFASRLQSERDHSVVNLSRVLVLRWVFALGFDYLSLQSSI